MHDSSKHHETVGVPRGAHVSPATPTKVLLKVAEVAQRLNCSPSFVYQLVEQRRIAHLRIGKGTGGIRFLPDDVEAYLFGVRVGVRGNDVPAMRPRQLKHLRLGRSGSASS